MKKRDVANRVSDVAFFGAWAWGLELYAPPGAAEAWLICALAWLSLMVAVPTENAIVWHFTARPILSVVDGLKRLRKRS